MEKKSIAALIVTGAMVLGLSACGTNGATSGSADNSQSTSTPVVTDPVDTSSQTQEVEETTPDTAETTPVSQEETQPAVQPQEETPVSEEVGPKFTEVNETVYATTSVNVRSSFSADSNKVGSLATGASITRTGVEDNGWSRIVYGDSAAYVNSSYLSTTKPSTGGNTSSGGNISSVGSTSGGTVAPEEIPDWATGGSTSSGGDTAYDLQEKTEAAGGEFNTETGGGWVPNVVP